MTGLAGARYVDERAADPVVRDLHRALALIRHVAVRARDAAARVNALAPCLELRMLRLQEVGARFSMGPVVKDVPVRKLVPIVVALDLLDSKSVVPWIEERRLWAAVVLDMALAADERAHLLPRGVDVRIVRRRP